MRYLLAATILAVVTAAAADAGVLDRAKESRALTLGYRVDTKPFAYRGPGGEPEGYSVALCKAVADEVKATLGLDWLELRFVEVTAESRFEAIETGRIDLLCEATTMTLARRERIDFSLPTFATGATLLYRVDGPQDFAGLAGQKVGVRAGTTTIGFLERRLAVIGVTAEIVPVRDHDEGIRRLAAGELAAYFGDGAILLYHWLESPDRDRLRLSELTLSHEPYALALPRGDDEFRLVADRALARLYRDGGIDAVFTTSFGTLAKPSDLVRALYILNALPE
jgi:polar amino acid transport system substrate-binding protein/glutamate/aspartate transport system substrate-binding protein